MSKLYGIECSSINVFLKIFDAQVQTTVLYGAEIFNLDQRGKTNWVTNVRKTLCANGFSCVWHNQGVGCLNAFIREFRQRLIDIRWQAWDDHVNTNDRFSLYRQFKTLTGVEPYLMSNLNRHISDQI